MFRTDISAKEVVRMPSSDVKDNVKHAGAVLSQSGKELAATAREQAGPVSEALSAAVSSAATVAAERGRRAQKQAAKRAELLQIEARKRALELQKQAGK